MGPVASVVFSENPYEKSIEALKSVLEEKRYSIDFDSLYPGDEDWVYDDEELSLIKEKTSLSAFGEFRISCPCNSTEDHIALGNAAIIAANHLSGLIDFGGAICPALPPEISNRMYTRDGVEWNEVEPYFLEMVEKISGQIYTIEYET